MDNFWQLWRKKIHSCSVNHRISAIDVSPEGEQEPCNTGGSLCLVECPVEFKLGIFQFDPNSLTILATLPNLQKIISPDLYAIFPKFENFPNT